MFFLHQLALAALLTACSAGTDPASDPPPEASPSSYSPTTRTYFLAAEEVDWDYAPSASNRIRPEMGLGVWGEQRTYPKVRYVGYTDATFTERLVQPEHEGILGPTLRAVVGDTLEVHFRNDASRPYSIHPHGVFYDKDNEGAPYAGIPGAGHQVAPRGEYTYRWSVPPRAGPGPEDGSSVVWLYHSHVNPSADVNAGLSGAIIVTSADRASAEGTPDDVDREFVTLFEVYDENSDGGEEEGDLMHAMNGRIFGNLDGLSMVSGDRVRWYLLALGSEVDLHTPHWHGDTVLQAGRRTDTVELLPASMLVADMVAENPGTWLFHCHVADHVEAGMIALYRVGEGGDDAATP